MSSEQQMLISYRRRREQVEFSLAWHPFDNGVASARLCPGDPRLAFIVGDEDVDGRDKPGHDECLTFANYSTILRPLSAGVWNDRSANPTGHEASAALCRRNDAG
jgi:hypothetical protein